MDLLYFVLLVSSLIFIHESGHFAFAKIFGVKVLTFSIGFGPKVLRIRGKETEYCVGLLPFGGFVKMLEESKQSEPILPEDRQRTFEAQALWKRVVIVLAGPAMNVLFPIALYTSVFLEDEQFLPPTVGAGRPGQARRRQARTRATASRGVDGDEVTSFPEVQQVIARKAGKPVHARRRARRQDPRRRPSRRPTRPRRASSTSSSTWGASASTRASLRPSSAWPTPDSPAAQAKLQTFDRITAVNGRRIERFIEFVDALAENRGDQVVVSYLRPVYVPQRHGRPLRARRARAGRRAAHPHAAPPRLDPPGGRAARARPTCSLAPASRAPTSTWRSCPRRRASGAPACAPATASPRSTGRRSGSGARWRTSSSRAPTGATSSPGRATGCRCAGSSSFARSSGTTSSASTTSATSSARTTGCRTRPTASSRIPHPLTYALRRGVEETGSVIKFISVGVLRLAQGRLSLSSVSGPITLYDIAGQAGAKGPDVLRLDDGSHLGQPGHRQSAADPGARRRATCSFSSSRRRAASRCPCASGRWPAWRGWSC